MSELYLDKFRVGSLRKRGHDYTSPGAYFITITTDAMINWFGSVHKGKVLLSPVGKMVKEEWIKTEIVRDNIQLDAWIIMPNHIHGIIIIQHSIVETGRWAVSSNNKTIINNMSSNKTNTNQYQTSILKPNSIGSIICQFKSICTKRIRTKGYKHFKWQNQYYDHIIKNNNELNKISAYIKSNPTRW